MRPQQGFKERTQVTAGIFHHVATVPGLFQPRDHSFGRIEPVLMCINVEFERSAEGSGS